MIRAVTRPRIVTRQQIEADMAQLAEPENPPEKGRPHMVQFVIVTVALCVFAALWVAL